MDEDVAAASADAMWDATERLRAFEQAAPEGIVAVDRHGHVTIWNRAAEQLLGWRASDVIGQRDPLTFEDEEHEEDRALASRLRKGEVLSRVETRIRRKDGSPIPVTVSSGPIHDAQGGMRGTIRVLTDISETKRVAREFLQAQKMAALGQLAGGIAHDFNNLLTVIAGSSELVLERVCDRPDIAADVKAIKHAGERAAQLTRQLLALSRTHTWVPQVLDLNQVIDAFQRVLHRVVRENISLNILTVPALGSTKADPGQVEQVVLNLVVNARDAMPVGGTLTIATANMVVDETLAWRHGAVAGRYVALTVEDTGCGMTPDIAARVFEPFFTTKGPEKGSGLGLSSVFALLEQNGGFVTVDSTVGVGTVVTTYWPTVDDEVERTVSRSAERTRPGTETILLVEDEDGLRQLMGRVLDRQGYRVLPARDAEEALAIHEGYADAIHLLVSDIIMPGCGGPDLAQHIIRHRPAIQVLLVSGYAPRAAHQLGQRLRQVGFLQKPFTPSLLAAEVRASLDRYLDPVTRPSSTM